MVKKQSLMESLVNQNLFNSFFQNKTVLITGDTGFKGSWLSLWLKLLGANIVGFSLKAPISSPSHHSLLDLKITSHQGNMQNREELDKVIVKYQPEIIFNLAAQSLVRKSYANPENTYLTNINGTINILESIRSNLDNCCFINVTSDKAYENRETLKGYVETDPMGGFDPYSASKGCAEIITSSYRRSFFKNTPNVKIATARAGNVIGGGDWAKDRIIPDLIRSLEKNTQVSIRNPQSVRPWQHVLEPLSGYLLLAQKMGESGQEFNEAWNFGSEEAPISVIDIVKNTALVFPDLKYKLDINPINAHEASLLSLNCDKSKKKLSWKAVWGMDETLTKTLEWYKSFYSNKESTLEASTQDVFEYIKKAKQLKIKWAQ